MAAGTYNFILEQGATFSRRLTVQENNSALDLTGYTGRAQMRSTHDSDSIALSFTVAISDATNGILSMSASATSTASLTPGQYVYDVEIESSAGSVTRLLQGTVTVNPEVTK